MQVSRFLLFLLMFIIDCGSAVLLFSILFHSHADSVSNGKVRSTNCLMHFHTSRLLTCTRPRKGGEMNKVHKLVFSLVTVIAITAVAESAQAATKYSRSHKTSRTFWNCEQQGRFGICLPFIYLYDAAVNVTYTSTYDSRRRVNVVTIKEVDQSVSMYGAANNGNPCGVGLGISVEVYNNLGRRVATLYGTRQGSYLIGRGTLIYGRVSNPNITVDNPTFKATSVAASAQCFNWPSSLSWSFNVP